MMKRRTLHHCCSEAQEEICRFLCSVAEEVQNNEPGMGPLLGGRKGRFLVDRLGLSIVVFFASTRRPTRIMYM